MESKDKRGSLEIEVRDTAREVSALFSPLLTSAAAPTAKGGLGPYGQGSGTHETTIWTSHVRGLSLSQKLTNLIAMASLVAS